jgi:GNAT superfamily N-acetyltransferase
VTVQRVRRVRPEDVTAVVGLVHELADYEREPASCTLTDEQLRAALFGPEPALFGHVAEVDGADGPEVVGCALWFLNFSTWRGAHGVYLEDLYVRPEHRGTGLGKALLAALAAVCVERDYARLEWVVLDWNEPSIRFYRSIGAAPNDGWTTFRLDGEPLAALGALSPARPGGLERASARSLSHRPHPGPLADQQHERSADEHAGDDAGHELLGRAQQAVDDRQQ